MISHNKYPLMEIPLSQTIQKRGGFPHVPFFLHSAILEAASGIWFQLTILRFLLQSFLPVI